MQVRGQTVSSFGGLLTESPYDKSKSALHCSLNGAFSLTLSSPPLKGQDHMHQRRPPPAEAITVGVFR
jgi:hypothetical protein